MPTLVIATRNRHKVEEISTILGPKFRCLALSEFPAAPPVREDAQTFAGNATKKAVEIAKWIAWIEPGFVRANPHGFVIADDSGLEVDALQGAPGVHSARFAMLDTGASGNSSDTDNNAKLLRLLQDVPAERRSARFRCAIALAPLPAPAATNSSPVCEIDEREFQTEAFDGTCEGRIDFAPRGEGGFGYDPLFIPTGSTRSFAELSEGEKNRISHRACALAKVREWFAARGG